MKKIVLLSLFALCLPLVMTAQSNDDLYFTPSKDKKEVKKNVKETTPKRENYNTNTYTSSGSTVVVQDKKGNIRDVDEYNRRYSASDNEFAVVHDTIYIKEKAQPDLEGEWVNGFDGSQEDYEYAERIVRFRNPRYAIHISSPYYWDVVYGLNSWNWNVYTDGFYAYAFPTFSNRLWWDWRYGSYGIGWGGYYGGYWPGYYGWGGYWGHHHHHHYWGGGRPGHSWGHRPPLYTSRPSIGSSSRPGIASRPSTRPGSAITSRPGTSSSRPGVSTRPSTSTRPGTSVSTRPGTSTRPGVSTRPGTGVNTRPGSSTRPGTNVTTRPGSSTPGRVVGTRPSGQRPGSNVSTRPGNSSGSVSTRPGYTRPSNSGSNYGTGSSSRPSGVSTRPSTSGSSRGSAPSYNRGSSSSTRNYSPGNTNSRPNSSSTRSYSPSSSSSRSGSYSTGSRSSGGSSRSSGGSSGGSSRGSRR